MKKIVRAVVVFFALSLLGGCATMSRVGNSNIVLPNDSPTMTFIVGGPKQVTWEVFK